MKTRFTTIDLRAAIAEIGGRLLGLRVFNVYDINNKTYLIRLFGPDIKEVLLIESGFRVHMTSFDWPKNNMPSNFSMKLRKHIKGRRLENIRQLGMDRAVDLQFGSGEAAYHLVVELYDRGNIALTDHEFTIMMVLRARADNDDVRFAVREKYPLDKVRKAEEIPDEDRLKEILLEAKPGQNMKKILNPNFVFGPALIEHCLQSTGFPSNATFGKDFDLDKDCHRLVEALAQAQHYLQASGQPNCKGYIIQKREKKPSVSAEQKEDTELLTFHEFHPFLFKQFEDGPYLEFASLTECLDEFFSKQESQKLDIKAFQQEKVVMKKLDNVKKDQERRISSLQKSQSLDQVKGELIEMNLTLVDEAIRVVRSAIANQIDWKEIEEIIKDAQKQGDVVAKAVKSLKLEMNHITIQIQNPYLEFDSDGSDAGDPQVKGQPVKIDIDLGLSAYANARKYFDLKKHSRKKEQKTKDAANKAIKSAEKKTKQALKDVAIVTSINKTRKTYWFEKFFWFISSENYLVIAGREKQQNEILYKRYLKPGDVYVHADLHGASSVIIKNHSGGPIPPKTLNEAGAMAVCFSVAWEAKVITSAWWVNADQVSKTAPTGEYLTTGSFMIRGKKNYLPPVQLMMGFGFLFKLEETCVWRHKGERKVWAGNEDDVFTVSSVGDFDEELILEEEVEEDDEDKQDALQDTARTESENITEYTARTESDITEETDSKESSPGEPHERLQQEGDIPDQEAESKAEEVAVASSEDDDGAFDFPDTSIELHHVTGNRSRSTGMLSVSSKPSSTNDDEDVVYLGDNEPIKLSNTREGGNYGTKHLSAKQRRELKKKKKQGWTGDEDEDLKDAALEETELREDQKNVRLEPHEDIKSEISEKKPPQTQPLPLKRGQKYRLKKMKQKYGDQDEEERRLKMELLASAGAPKEKKNKKGKKAKQKNKAENNEERQTIPQSKHQQMVVTGQVIKDEEAADEVAEGLENVIIKEDEGTTGGVESVEIKHQWRDKRQAASDDEAGEDTQLTQSSSIIDSLTGCPHEEDLLLFSIPVCAPYSAMQNYKYKVKVTPGTSKKGRAAKAALHMFQISKDCTTREKDLFKGCKDVDLSRNMPGKVKVSAPNLQKAKKQAKKS